MSRASYITVVVVAGLFAAWMPGGWELQGVVRDADSKPVANAWVEARQVKHGVLDAADFNGAPLHSMRSDRDGRWAFSHVGEGTWIVTAVASTESRTDAELQELARPSVDGRIPTGAAVTRFIRHFQAEQQSKYEKLDIGLATGSADLPLHGRLIGAFAPDRFGYEVRIRQPTVLAPGQKTVSVTKNSDAPNPTFSVVPDSEGRFDFGGLKVCDSDVLTVDCIALTTADVGLSGTSFTQQVAAFENWKDGVEVTLRSKTSVMLHAEAGEGSVLGRTKFTIWDEHGTEANRYDDERPRDVSIPLSDGTYIVRAMVGEWASPLTLVQVKASTEPMKITLPLQECHPFTLHLVDQAGAALGTWFLKLGTKASADVPLPCRVRLACMNGEVKVAGLLPGKYEVQFKWNDKVFIQELDLRPEASTVVVTMP